jgi:hypothetical protein
VKPKEADMFMQVIQGQVIDAEEMRRAMDRWVAELAPGAKGWLGSTGGVTEDGRFIATARFESEDAARANSDRPEQGMWWSQAEKSLSDVVFHDCNDVMLINGGGSDRAGFVQVMQTTDSDVAKLKQMNADMSEAMSQQRPDVLGMTAAVHEDGKGTTALVYFTSEAAAREGEKQPPPPELVAQMEEMGQAMAEVTYLDLRDPWMYSA